MKNEFTDRGVRLLLTPAHDGSFTWTVFPDARTEITGTITGNPCERTLKLAVSEACEEIDAWLDGVQQDQERSRA